MSLGEVINKLKSSVIKQYTDTITYIAIECKLTSMAKH